MARKKVLKKRGSKRLQESGKQGKAHDRLLRDHLLFLLNDGGAHAHFDDAIGDWPVQLAGVKVANFPHTAWMLLEHMRLAQWDILEFIRDPKHLSPDFPSGYWPKADAPPDDAGWNKSVGAFRGD